MKTQYYVCLTLVFLLLAGCGGGGGDVTVADKDDSGKTNATSGTSEGADSAGAASDTTEAEPEEEIKELPAEVKALIEKANTRIKSVSFSYRGPTDTVERNVYVKGTKMKTFYQKDVNINKDQYIYNTIYLDTVKKTADAYCWGCTGYRNAVEGWVKKADYEEEYVKIPMEWYEDITEAEKRDEMDYEGRKTARYDTNIGLVTMEKYYGWIYFIEDGKNKWEFTEVAFNSVKDADINP